MEAEQMQLMQELYSINPNDVGDLNAQLMSVSEQMATVRQDKARAQPKGLMNEYFKISFEISSEYRGMNEQELRQTMDTSCDVDLLHDLHRELQRRLGLNGDHQAERGERYMKFVDNRIREQIDVANGTKKRILANYVGDNVAYQRPEMLPREALRITEAEYETISYR
ncbi:unnamed protein product [Oikopleura dioica]|uniref:Uncharacterized protein n=1 Tax=Oikopleura dioica TaxID=34765 RepID=E4WW77_OIKDI|nr:unnamed protein product [Oikopleura dioica]CBY33670.1 unnamed protein product [Oikopleura dioica]